MGFDVIFRKAWEDYKRNFLVILSISLIFFIIPSLVYLYISTYAKSFFFGRFGLSIFLAFLFSVWVSLFGSTSLVSASLKNKRFNLKTALALGRKLFLPVTGFYILLSIFLLGLFILLVIPGIIFFIYWIFSLYIFVERRQGIRSSFKESHRLVKGKWWATLGYSVLLGLIMIIPFAVLGVLGVLLGFVIGKTTATLFNDVMGTIFQGIFLTPLSFLFYKHLYLAYKKERKG